MKLAPWQKRFIRDIYEPYRNNKRVVRRAILSVARKNGKTALIAALVLVHLDGPEAIPNGEIYSAANDRDQAAIVFNFAKQFVLAEPELQARIDVVSSKNRMIGRKTASVYRAISAEAGTKHGYLPSLVIYDELAQAKNRELYDVLDTSFGARKEPLMITISTQSNDPNHILSKLIDDGLSKADPSIVCHLYAADEYCDLGDEKQWRKANPALDDFRDREDLETSIAKAQRLTAEEPKVRNLFLNQRVAPMRTLIPGAEWKACIGVVDLEPGEAIYCGLDLSSTIDLTALVIGSASDPTRVESYFWKPIDELDEHSRRDFGAGNARYQQWLDEGHLLASPGRSIDPTVVAMFLAKLSQRYEIKGIAYDRWRIDDLLRAFDDIGLRAYRDDEKNSGDGLRMVPWGQGFKEMAPAIDALERAIFERSFAHSDNPILNWNLSNAVVVTDPSGNRKLDKDKAKFRIDGAVALAMMMGLRSRDRAGAVVDLQGMIG